MIRKTDKENGNRRANEECQSDVEGSSDSIPLDILLEEALPRLVDLVKNTFLAVERQLIRIEQIEEERVMESEQGAYMEFFFDCDFAFGNR